MAFAPKSARAHIVYKNAKQQRIPGVTTIVGQRAKHLERWVAKIVRDGYDYDEYMRAAANVGSAGHEMIQARLEGRKPSLHGYTREELRYALNVRDAFKRWAKEVELETVFCELPMVSEELQVGGTLDWYGRIDGVLSVIDFKSSDSGIYLDNLIQVAQYARMAVELGYEVDQFGIVRTGKERGAYPEVKLYPYHAVETGQLHQVFEYLRELYELDKTLKKAMEVR